MPQKIILTEEQHYVVINHMLREMVEVDSTMNEEMIDEGVWEKIKYGLSKLGRYKAGGKIMGKGKIDQAAAAKIQQIIDTKGNEVIKNLDAAIKEKNPEFPNNEKGADFLDTIMEISKIYDTIVGSTLKNPNDKDYLTIDQANGLINHLKDYVQKFLDVDLTAAYSVVDEAEGNVIELSEEELKALDESFDIDSDDEVNEDEADNVRKTLQAKRGEGGKDFDSERMKTLKSNKLPLLLAGIGGSMGAFSWLANTEWFKHLFDQPYNYTDTQTTTELIQQKSEVLNDIKNNEGVYKLLGRVTEHPLNANSKPQELVDALKQIGGGDANKGVDLLCQKGGVMMKPTEAAKGLHDLVNNPNQYKTLNDMFHDGASGTGKLNPNTTLYGTIAGRNLTSILVKMVPQIVTKVAIKTGIKTGAGYLAAKGFGAVLGPIGLAVLSAGALVKIMRMKGQRQSRAKTLNDLLQSMLNLDGGTGIVEPNGPTIDKNEAQDPKKIEDKGKEEGGKGDGKGDGKGGNKSTGSGSNDDLYNSLKNLFKFVVNNRKMLGVRTADNVGAGGATGDNLTIRPGAKVVWNTTTKKKDENGRPIVNRMKGVVSDEKSENPNETIVNIDGDPKKVTSVSTNKLTPDREKKSLRDLKNFEENTKLNNNHIFEGKYIKDKDLIKKLEKNLSFDKLKSFEDFINRVEIIRNKVKKINSSNDKKLANILSGLDSNPIMATNFEQLFAIDPKNQQAVNALKAFIDDIFVTVYSGKFKHGNMIDKMADLGGSINKLEEADKTYSFKSQNKAFVKDAQDRGRFKNNLINFLVTAISLFQHLHELKMKAEKGGGKKGGTTASGDSTGGSSAGTPTATPPSGGDAGASAADASSGTSGGADDDDEDTTGGKSSIPFKPATYESVNGQNKILTEEVERIKKIMRSLI
jgi:hypothetical protein